MMFMYSRLRSEVRMSHYLRNLSRHIIGLSEASTWGVAKLEWELDHVENVFDTDDEAEHEECPCGHYPISELCWIRNTKNGNETFVGNVCVKKFMGMQAGTVAAGFRRVLANRQKALNEAATLFAFDKGWINEWERDFCLDTKNKRKLTGRQLAKREQINDKVLRLLHKRGDDRRRKE